MDPASEETKTIKLIREVKSILNKLTPEKEEHLKTKFCNELRPDTYDRLEKLVAALFSKAIEEAHFAELYARLCRHCHDTWAKEDKFSFAFNKDTNTYKEPVKNKRILYAQIFPARSLEVP